MKTFELKGDVRDLTGKKASKANRNDGKIPCVLYGGENVFHFSVEREAVRKLVYTPEIFLVNLTVGENKCTAIMKDIQFHPVKDTILHMDFLQVSADKPIVIDVPVSLEGLAEGVRAGGKLTLESRKLKVRGLYKDIPEKLTINIEHLGLGKSIQVGQVAFDKLELLNAKNNVICAVKLTRAARGLAAKNG